MRIGILGGSFNPPHKLHLNIALDMLDNNLVDKVIFVPNIYNPLGKTSIDANHRLAMLKLMIEDKKDLEVSDIELKKDKQNYTYQTLDELHSLYPNDEIILIIGSDNLKVIDKWMNYDYLLNNYKVIVTKRDDDNIDDIINDKGILKYENNLIIYNKHNSSALSSTYIRDLLLKGEDVTNYLDDKVSNYIKEYHLYEL
jgi:nicotinate-nucleotide adenylyltransferase